MSNYLQSAVDFIHEEYLDLLKRTSAKYSSINYTGQECMYLADELELFWTRKSNQLDFFLNTLSPNDSVYMFTGAVNCSVDDYDDVVISLMGNTQIYDDQLVQYCNILALDEGRDEFGVFKDVVINAIEDTVKLLEHSKEIIVLPCRHLIEKELMSVVSEQANKLVLSLFKNEYDNVQSLLETIFSVDQIEQSLHDNVLEMILLHEKDDARHPLSRRLNEFREVSVYKGVSDRFTDGELFYMAVFSQVVQALMILTTCRSYNAIPVVRSRLTIQYIALICQQDSENPLERARMQRTLFAHNIYKCFDLGRVQEIDHDHCLKKARDFDLVDYSMKRYDSMQIEEYFAFNEMLEIASDALNQFYNMLKEE